jgi:hypothetical protein
MIMHHEILSECKKLVTKIDSCYSILTTNGIHIDTDQRDAIYLIFKQHAIQIPYLRVSDTTEDSFLAHQFFRNGFILFRYFF